MNTYIRERFFSMEPADRLRLIKQLTPREEGVVKMLYGVADDGRRAEPHKFDEVGLIYAVSRPRMSEIVLKTERKIWSKMLLDYWPSQIESIQPGGY